MDIGAIIGGIFIMLIILALLGGAIKTFQRNWVAALLLLIFLFPIWAIWAFIEVFTDDVPSQAAMPPAPMPPQQQYYAQPQQQPMPAPAPAPPTPPVATKECPFCAETVREAAVICRYCQRDLPVTLPEPEAPARSASSGPPSVPPPPPGRLT